LDGSSSGMEAYIAVRTAKDPRPTSPGSFFDAPENGYTASGTLPSAGSGAFPVCGSDTADT